MLKLAKMSTPDKALGFVFAPYKKIGGLVVARSVAAGHAKRAWALRDANNPGKTISGRKRIDGVCYGKAGDAGDDADGGGEEDLKGKLVFELPKDPKAGLAKSLMMTILAQTNKRMKVTVKGPNTEIRDDQDSDEMEERAEQRLSELRPAVEAALRARGPNAARIQTLFAAATGLVENDDLEQADDVLDELAPLLKPSEAAGAADPGAEWKAKLAEWTPDIKTALAAKGPNAADVGKLYAQATALSKPGGDMAQAIARLTECHALATATASSAAAGTTQATEQAPTGGAAAFLKRLSSLSAAIREASNGPNKLRVTTLFQEALGRKDAGDFASAMTTLDELEPLLTAGTGEAGAEWEAKLAEIEPAYLRGCRDRPEAASGLRAVMGFAQAKAEKGDFAGAVAALQKLRERLGEAPPAGGQASPATEPQAAAARWAAERTKAVAKLQDELKAVAASEHPDVGDAELELRAVIAQLSGAMETRRQATEMESYLEKDDVVAAVSQLAFDLKTPLLAALGEIKPRLTA